MAFLSRRYLSAASSKQFSAAEACSEILERFGNKPISIRRQLLDPNQVRLLSLTVGRPDLHNGMSITEELPKHGTHIPPGYHLAYFTPATLEKNLGQDGSDRTVNPLSPFTRRMWAGGELEWSQDPTQSLKVGQVVQESTTLLSAEPKTLKTGAEMLVVGVEKVFETDHGVALVDRRNWVFQEAIVEAKAPAQAPAKVPFPQGSHMRDFTQTNVTLFRFSALTFNGHKIHYCPEWCREVEGHRNPVVHGPLNLINMLDFWRDTARGAEEGAVPKSIKYRAMNPLYINEVYRALLKKEDEWKVEIWDSFGKQSMRATIED